MNAGKTIMATNVHILKNRNFLLLFFGRLISTAGSAIFFVAIVWAAATKVGGVGPVSLVLMATAIPSAIFSPFAGVLADRKRKKWIVIFTDLISGIVLFLMLIFLNAEFGQLWILLGVVFTIQILSTFFNPALQSLVPLIVKDEELSNANALLSMTGSISQLIGMAIGGILIAVFGLYGAILVDGVSFIFSGISEIFLEVDEVKKDSKKGLGSIFSEIKEGFAVVFRKADLGGLIVTESIIDFFGTPIFIFLPLIITRYMNGGSAQYGLMQSLMGVGTIVASVLLSFMPEPKRKFFLMAISTFILGSCMSFIGIKQSYFVLAPALLILGFFSGIANVIQNVILQRSSPKEVRGRVFSFRSTLNSGLRPVSYGFAGLISTLFPITTLLVYLGILSGLCGFAYFFISKKVIKVVSR
ncbi:MFS transporter [Athalassotoga saccharophila]|uniref:MFS transporter n=1 Tax=Athalassotoga saccharophila TaxID=1441386 RepID=UPI00137AF855|nr:MFS transporter [Athalassotoga saccharophila]BBJ28380.1 putative bacilysin exporter BacE [Athalassotoga saccharophila]